MPGTVTTSCDHEGSSVEGRVERLRLTEQKHLKIKQINKEASEQTNNGGIGLVIEQLS